MTKHSLQVLYNRHLSEAVDTICREMARRELTFAEVAEAAGIHPRTISRITEGQTRLPYFRTVVAMAHALGLEIALFTRKPSGRRYAV